MIQLNGCIDETNCFSPPPESRTKLYVNNNNNFVKRMSKSTFSKKEKLLFIKEASEQGVKTTLEK
jgi:hypothetical protein